jgi:hypothetical protein
MLFAITARAQTYTVEGIERVGSQSIKAILNEKTVIGYIMFFIKDKADKRNYNYTFDLLDEKLNKISSVNVVLPKGAILLKSTYNGTTLGLMFFDTNKKNYILKSFDRQLAPLGTKFIGDIISSELSTLSQMVASGSEEGFAMYGIHPVAGKGFVRPSYGDKASQYKITFFDNNFNEKWSYETPEEAKGLESFLISDINDKYITGITIRRGGILSKKLNYFLTVFDVDSGKKIIDASTESKKQQLSISSIILQEGSDQLIVQGEYYNETDRPGIDKSKGFYLKSYNLSNGKEETERLYSWDKDIAKLFNAKAKASIENKFLNYPHTLFKAVNGHYFMVFEQFKKAIDGGALILNLASGGRMGANVTKVSIGDVWILEMDANLNALNVNFFEKDQHVIELPISLGMTILPAGQLGMITKWYDRFDYQFIQRKEDGTFNISFLNHDKEKGEKAKTIIGNIFMPKDGKLSYDEIEATSTKKTSYFLFPGQSGYIMLAKFIEKEERLEFKLIKLNY